MKTITRAIGDFAKFALKELAFPCFCFFCGGLSTAAYAKLDFFEAMRVILHDAGLIFVGGIVGAIIGGIVGAFALHFWRTLRDRLRSRQELVEQHYAAAIDGQVFFRAVLHVPREWLQLPKEEEHRRARAQLKGQGPF